jgi:hypothetical protein
MKSNDNNVSDRSLLDQRCAKFRLGERWLTRTRVGGLGDTCHAFAKTAATRRKILSKNDGSAGFLDKLCAFRQARALCLSCAFRSAELPVKSGTFDRRGDVELVGSRRNVGVRRPSSRWTGRSPENTKNGPNHEI